MSSSIVSSNFGRWKDALRTRDAAQVAALYADDATLLPTMAKKVMTDRAGITSYFEFFDTFNPSVSQMVEEHTIPLGENNYVHCGVYRFHLTMNGQEQDVDARFSMVWRKTGDAWSIVHHHSSRIPAP